MRSVVLLGRATFTLLATACAAVTRGPRPQGDAERFARAMDSLRVAARIPGLAVAVVRDKRVVLARGFGHADVERRIPVTPDTPFNIASVTKPTSAVVGLKLVDLGVLDLDRPMRSYQGFPEFCAEAREAGGLFFADWRCDTDALTLRHVLSMTANGAPGSRFFYNPVSFSRASRPIAEVAGSPFSALVDRHVFRPAGMRRSARIHCALPLRAELAAALATP